MTRETNPWLFPFAFCASRCKRAASRASRLCLGAKILHRKGKVGKSSSENSKLIFMEFYGYFSSLGGCDLFCNIDLKSMKLRLHSSSCSTWQVIAEIFGNLAWHTSLNFTGTLTFFEAPSIWLSFFTSFRSSQTIILDGTTSKGWSSNIFMKHNSLNQNSWPRYFPNPPESVKRGAKFLIQSIWPHRW